LLHETSSLLTRIRYKELHAPHSGDPNRLSDTRDSSHVTVADDDVDNYRGESEAVFAAGHSLALNPQPPPHKSRDQTRTLKPRGVVRLMLVYTAALKWQPPPRCAGPAAITASAASPVAKPSPALGILCALSVGHLLNDTVQSLLPALYPLLKESLNLTFTQIGLITLAFQLTASLLQPVVGLFTDRHPQPYSLAAGMVLSLVGLLLLAFATTFPAVLIAGGLVGLGSSIFHPEASRVARLASGGRHGFAQSLFQVGGNAGSALGPLLAALFVAQHSQSRVAWFAAVPIVGGLFAARSGPARVIGRSLRARCQRQPGQTGNGPQVGVAQRHHAIARVHRFAQARARRPGVQR
jgi:hypothetical protein